MGPLEIENLDSGMLFECVERYRCALRGNELRCTQKKDALLDLCKHQSQIMWIVFWTLFLFGLFALCILPSWSLAGVTMIGLLWSRLLWYRLRDPTPSTPPLYGEAELERDFERRAAQIPYDLSELQQRSSEFLRSAAEQETVDDPRYAYVVAICAQIERLNRLILDWNQYLDDVYLQIILPMPTEQDHFRLLRELREYIAWHLARAKRLFQNPETRGLPSSLVGVPCSFEDLLAAERAISGSVARPRFVYRQAAEHGVELLREREAEQEALAAELAGSVTRPFVLRTPTT